MAHEDSPSTTTSQPSLTAFDSADTDQDGTALDGTKQAPDSDTATTAPERPTEHAADTLPEFCEWADERATLEGVGVAVPASDDWVDRPGGGVIHATAICYVTDRDALDNYRATHGEGTIDVPQYYSDLEEFDPIITAKTATSHRGGYGITEDRLRDALRALAGTGHYDHDAVTITACGRRPFVAECHTDDRDRAFLFDLKAVNPAAGRYFPPTDDTTEHHRAELTLPDDDTRVAEAVPTFRDRLATHFDIELQRHSKQDKRFHYFEGADGQQYRAAGRVICAAAKGTRKLESLLGEHTVETDAGETYTAEWDDLHYDLGDSPTGSRKETAVFSAAFRYSDPRTGNRASLSGRIKAYATYYYFTLDEETRTDTDVITIEVAAKDEVIGRFTPDNDEYDPIGSHS